MYFASTYIMLRLNVQCKLYVKLLDVGSTRLVNQQLSSITETLNQHHSPISTLKSQNVSLSHKSYSCICVLTFYSDIFIDVIIVISLSFIYFSFVGVVGWICLSVTLMLHWGEILVEIICWVLKTCVEVIWFIFAL